jgi:cell division protein FtsL
MALARRTGTDAAGAGARWNGQGGGLSLLLMAAVVLSALLVVRSSHECRQLYASLQKLEAEQWHLQEDYSRLLLEQSAWASHYRVEKVATGELGMQSPDAQELRVVLP